MRTASGGAPGGARKKGAAEDAREASLTATLAAELADEFERLIGAPAAHGIDFEALERGCRDAALGVMGRLVAAHLNVDRGDTCATAACDCGAAAPYVDRREKTFTTALGPLTPQRAWYHCAACGHGFGPRDRELALDAGSLSPAVRRMVGVAAAETSFGNASGLLRELAGLDVGAKQVERHAEALGRDIARDEAAVVESAPPVADTLYVGLDGTGVPVRPSETAGRVGKQADGTAKTREVKLVAVWSAEDRDRHGMPRRDADSTSYNAAIESVASRDTDRHPAPFAARVLRELERRGYHRAARRVVLGDGATWSWNCADEHLPGAIQIVDLFHAKEHIFEVAKAIYGDSDLAAQWGKARRDELDRYGAGPIVAALRQHVHGNDDVRRELEYFTVNRERMHYPAFRAQGLCVTTGVLEGGCKSVVGNRLKRGGMHWTVAGANAILALRCAIRSNRFDDYWERRAANP